MIPLLALLLLGCGKKDADSGAAVGQGRVFTVDQGNTVLWIEPDPNLGGPEGCQATCPGGTQVASFDATDTTAVQSAVDAGAFMVVEGRCEALCTPVQPCFPPAVPVVDQSGFTCQALAGFSTMEPTAQVDTSFGAVWVEGEHQP